MDKARPALGPGGGRGASRWRQARRARGKPEKKFSAGDFRVRVAGFGGRTANRAAGAQGLRKGPRREGQGVAGRTVVRVGLIRAGGRGFRSHDDTRGTIQDTLGTFHHFVMAFPSFGLASIEFVEHEDCSILNIFSSMNTSICVNINKQQGFAKRVARRTGADLIKAQAEFRMGKQTKRLFTLDIKRRPILQIMLLEGSKRPEYL